jgi:hypothetical protein
MNSKAASDETKAQGSNERPSFIERVYALAGQGAWREPGTASGTSHLRNVPTAHMVAAALSFGRQGRDDVGPDIAIDIATGLPGHRVVICAALGKALAGDRSALVRRNRAYIAHAAAAAYTAAMGQPQRLPPDGVDLDDWCDLVAAGAHVLEVLADEALRRAERRHRRAA